MNKSGEREEQIETLFICFATTCLYFQEDYSNLLLQLPWNNLSFNGTSQYDNFSQRKGGKQI